MGRWVQFAGWVALSVVAPSCGGSGDSILTTPEERMFAASYADVVCSHIDTCCPAVGYRPRSQAECRAQAADDIWGLRAAGPVFDARQAAICLATISREYDTCVFPIWDSLDCVGVWHGEVPLGGRCDFSFDCVVIDGSRGGCWDNACAEQHTSEEGGPCGAGPDANHVFWQCDEDAGLFCETQTGVCQRVPALGEPCPSQICAPHSRCDGSVCQPLTPTGGACDQFTDSCRPDGQCLDGTCWALKNPGDSCNPATDACLICACLDGHCAFPSPYCR